MKLWRNPELSLSRVLLRKFLRFLFGSKKEDSKFQEAERKFGGGEFALLKLLSGLSLFSTCRKAPWLVLLKLHAYKGDHTTSPQGD